MRFSKTKQIFVSYTLLACFGEFGVGSRSEGLEARVSKRVQRLPDQNHIKKYQKYINLVYKTKINKSPNIKFLSAQTGKIGVALRNGDGALIEQHCRFCLRLNSTAAFARRRGSTLGKLGILFTRFGLIGI